MKDIHQALKEDYSEHMNSLKFSDKRKLYKLYEEPKHTPMLKKVVAFQIVAATLIVSCAVTGAATVGRSMRDIIADKAKDSGFTKEQINEMADRLENYNIDPNSIEKSENSFSLSMNKYGQTIGSLESGAELCAVETKTEDGEDIIGYCYFDDLMELNGISMNGELKNTISNWIYVYDIDGIQVLGKFVDGGFKTNEQLENSNIICKEAEEYEALSQSRIDKNLSK